MRSETGEESEGFFGLVNLAGRMYREKNTSAFFDCRSVTEREVDLKTSAGIIAGNNRKARKKVLLWFSAAPLVEEKIP